MVPEEKRLLGVFDDILNIVALGRSRSEWNSVDELLDNISQITQRTDLKWSNNYNEIINITRRCMKLVRESKIARKSIDIDETSLVNILMGSARATSQLHM